MADIPLNSDPNAQAQNGPSSPGLVKRITAAFADPRLFLSEVTAPRNTAEGIPRPDRERMMFGGDPGGNVLDTFMANMPSSRKRQDLYRQYADMEECFPEIAAGLDMYADYTVSGGGTEKADSFEVIIEGNKYEEELKKVEERVRLKDKAWSIVRGMVRDGDEFHENIADPLGLSKIRALPKSEMYRNEDEIGNLPIQDAFMQRRNQKKVLFDQWQITHWKLAVNADDKYGRSILWSARRLSRELQLMEDSLTLARLSRAHQRLKYIVDVGKADAAAQNEIIEEFRQRNKRVRVINRSTGRMSLKRNPMLAEEDIYVPRMEGGAADVQTIQGDRSMLAINDILHKYDRMFAALKISKAWFGLTGPNIRSVVGEQGLNFMRTVRRVRNDFTIGAEKVYMIGLRLQGVTPEELANLELKFKFPMMSHADDELRFKLEQIKLAVAQQYRSLQLMSRHDILTKIICMEDDEATETLAHFDEEKESNPSLFANPGAAGPGMPGGIPGGAGGQASGDNVGGDGAGLRGGIPSQGEGWRTENFGVTRFDQRMIDTAVSKAIQSDPTLSATIASCMELVEHVRDALYAA